MSKASFGAMGILSYLFQKKRRESLTSQYLENCNTNNKIYPDHN